MSQNPNPNDPNGGFTPVSNKVTSEQIEAKAYRFGVICTRKGGAESSSFTAQEINATFKLTAEVAPTAFVLSHDNDSNRAFPITKLKVSDWTTFLDMQCMQWGKADDNQFKGMFSFWLATDDIKPNLEELGNNNKLSKFLKESNMTMTTHRLHESIGRNVGFFLGKDPAHTWRDDPAERIRAHWRKNRNEDAPPLHVKKTTIRTRSESAWTVSLFVGDKDADAFTEVLGDMSNSLPSFIPMELKRKNQEDFDNQLKIHNNIVAVGTAVKITEASRAFRQELQKHAGKYWKGKVIDVASTSHTPTSGTLYVQCLQEFRDDITNGVQIFITQFKVSHASEKANIPEPKKDDQTEQTSNTKQTATNTVTPFSYMLNATPGSIAPSRATQRQRQPKIPKAIATTNTYASVAAKFLEGTDNASVESQANSSIKTQREIELEEANAKLVHENEALTERVSTLETHYNKLQSNYQDIQSQLAHMMTLLQTNLPNAAALAAPQQQSQQIQSTDATLQPQSTATTTSSAPSIKPSKPTAPAQASNRVHPRGHPQPPSTSMETPVKSPSSKKTRQGSTPPSKNLLEAFKNVSTDDPQEQPLN